MKDSCLVCKHKMFSDCYMECSKAIRGIVNANSICPLFERGEPMKYSDLEPSDYFLHHTALAPGYVSRTIDHEEPREYHGRFGDGYTVDFPNFASSRYVNREYWIKKRGFFND